LKYDKIITVQCMAISGGGGSDDSGQKADEGGRYQTELHQAGFEQQGMAKR
jgi:hypothetical protein